MAGILAQTLATSALGAADPLEQDMINRTNQDRANAGLSALMTDPSMLQFARQRASAQQGEQPLRHTDANGMLPFLQMLLQAKVLAPGAYAGENLANSYPWQPAAIETALMNSPLHRANIMDPRWTQMAVGAWQDPKTPGGDLAYLYR